MLFGIAAYGIWALFPFYFHAVAAVSPIEVVTQRIIWAFVLLCIVITVTRRWTAMSTHLADRRAVGLLAIAAVFVGANWSVYVYAIATDQALQASLGYFVNPLVVVGLGVLVLKERLRPAQWLAVAIAALAVVTLTVSYRSLPWVALLLAVSFATYGFIKKHVGYPAVESTAIETGVLTPFAVVALTLVTAHGQAVYTADGWSMSLLLIMAGPLTTIPLLLFSGAATRLPLSTLGLMQYITPIGLFIVGIACFHEPMNGLRWVGFLLTWLALVIFTVDAMRHRNPDRIDEQGAQLLPAE